MPIGPGKYGARAEALLREVGGQLCCVITLDAAKGSAFDVATTNASHLQALPNILRDVAEAIERDLKIASH